jgi:hypothetical protein
MAPQNPGEQLLYGFTIRFLDKLFNPFFTQCILL